MVKAVMIARLNSLMQAYSGVHPEMVELLKELINKNVSPCIFEHGGVGASGDLVQLAHLALVLIGEGEVIYEGNVQPTAEVFSKTKYQTTFHSYPGRPCYFKWHFCHDGYWYGKYYPGTKITGMVVMLSAMINEVVEAFDDHYSYELNIVKHHKGQNKIAASYGIF